MYFVYISPVFSCRVTYTKAQNINRPSSKSKASVKPAKRAKYVDFNKHPYPPALKHALRDMEGTPGKANILFYYTYMPFTIIEEVTLTALRCVVYFLQPRIRLLKDKKQMKWTYLMS